MPTDPVSEPPLWYQVFQEFMCRLYRAFGGDCRDLDWGDSGGTPALMTVRSAFEAQGPPVFEDQEDADAFLANIASLEAHLGSPNSTITQALAAQIMELLDEVRVGMLL